MEIYNFDFNSGFYERSGSIIKDKDIHNFAIVNHSQAKKILEQEQLFQFLSEVDKTTIVLTNEDKLSFKKQPIFYSGENGIYYRTYLTEMIKPINTQKTCISAKYSSYCAGVLPTHNIFEFELPGFKIHEIGIFMRKDKVIFICDTSQLFVVKTLREFMNETFFVLGPAFMILLILKKNYQLISELIEQFQQLGTEFIEQIIKLKYKQIENFNFIINKYELNLINLVNYVDTIRHNAKTFNSARYPFFSNLVSGRNIYLKNTILAQNEFYDEDNGGFELKEGSLGRIKEYIENVTNNNNRFEYNNGIQGESGVVNFKRRTGNTKKKSCECDAKDYIINNFRFKGSGNFIEEIPANVCVVKNTESCDQAFQYKSNKYYLSLSNEEGKPVVFSIALYNEIYETIVSDLRRMKGDINDLVDKSDQILTRSFERLEFYNSRNMSILTIVSTIFLPTSFLAGWYGMNVPNIPEFTQIYAYPVVALITILIIIGYLYFYRDILFLENVEYKETRNQGNRGNQENQEK
jgi:Mg2+ and Co2+ transporter CorA